MSRLSVAVLLSTVLAVGGLATVAVAAYDSSTPMGSSDVRRSDIDRSAMPSANPMAPERLLRSSDIIGMRVQNTQGERLGAVKDLVIADKSNRIAFAVVSLDRAVVKGGKYVAVPWSILTVGDSGKVLVLNIDKGRLAGAPVFNSSQWPDFSNAEWRASVKSFFGVKHEATMRTDHAGVMERSDVDKTAAPVAWISYRATDIVDLDVRNRAGEKLGKIHDLFIDGQQGHLVYALVDYGGFLGINPNRVIVPWTALDLKTQGQVALIDSDRATFERLSFHGAVPNLTNREYAMRIYNTFNQQPYWEVYGYPGSEGIGGSLDVWIAGSDYNKNFNASGVRTIEGTVDSVSAFTPAAGALQGLSLRVKTDRGDAVLVQVGPQDFVSGKGFTFAAGDKVKITGCEATINDRAVVLAGEIDLNGRTLKLRDSSGAPVWTANDLRINRSGTDNTRMPERNVPGISPAPSGMPESSDTGDRAPSTQPSREY